MELKLLWAVQLWRLRLQGCCVASTAWPYCYEFCMFACMEHLMTLFTVLHRHREYLRMREPMNAFGLNPCLDPLCTHNMTNPLSPCKADWNTNKGKNRRMLWCVLCSRSNVSTASPTGFLGGDLEFLSVACLSEGLFLSILQLSGQQEHSQDMPLNILYTVDPA